MSDLIDRKALIESIGIAEECEQCQYNDTVHKGFCTMPSEFVNVCEAIADAPSAEPEIIHCKDCRHNGSFDTDCPINWNGKEYCSFAER